MAPSRVDNTALVFDLTGEGEGGFYRAPMTNAPGELNRRIMVNRGGKFQVLANLLDVVHGTTKSTGGTDATLLIACFHFLPSSDKRFVEATITWTFTSDDPAIQISVVKASLAGCWSLSPTKQTRETNGVGRTSFGPATGLVTATTGGEFSMKRTTELNFYTAVNGITRVLKPSNGGSDESGRCITDTARWTLSENKGAKRGANAGICRMLQVGILLERTVREGHRPQSELPPRFRGELEIVVDKNGLSQAASMTKRVWKKAEKDDAIEFLPGKDLSSCNFDIDKDNLSSIDLDQDVMFMSLHESFDELRREREERAKKRREEDKKRGQATSGRGGATSLQLSIWVFYIVVGIVAMYLWKDLTSLFGYA